MKIRFTKLKKKIDIYFKTEQDPDLNLPDDTQDSHLDFEPQSNTVAY